MLLQSMYNLRLTSQAYDGDKNGIILLLDERLWATRKTISALCTARYISKSKGTTLLLTSVIIALRRNFTYTVSNSLQLGEWQKSEHWRWTFRMENATRCEIIIFIFCGRSLSFFNRFMIALREIISRINADLSSLLLLLLFSERFNRMPVDCLAIKLVKHGRVKWTRTCIESNINPFAANTRVVQRPIKFQTISNNCAPMWK